MAHYHGSSVLPQFSGNALAGTSPLERMREAAAALVAVVDAGLGLAVTTLFTWQRRVADRIALQSLDDHMLRDIGLSRADIEQEAGKPFWKP